MQRNKGLIRCLVMAALQLATMVPLSQSCRAQNIRIVGKTKIYREAVRRDHSQRMVELHSLAPSIVYDLRYSTSNNFMGRVLYEQGTSTYLRLQPARALAAVQDSLRMLGLGLKIFDAYRPYAVTQRMWKLVHDERYVADPARGSGHNRGLAVDLTLINLQSGKELPMGTGFDNFSDSAHSDFQNLPPAVSRNRALLHSLMEHFGFTVLPTEWWHFYWPNDRNYDVLDLPFRKLQ